MALHSDKNGCKSNLFTLYNEAKARGASVRENEKGVPFLFYNWNKYVNRNNPEQIISRSDYLKLAPEDISRNAITATYAVFGNRTQSLHHTTVSLAMTISPGTVRQ